MDITNQIVQGSRGNGNSYDSVPSKAYGGESSGLGVPRSPIQQVNAEIAYHETKLADLKALSLALEENPGVEKVLNALSRLTGR